MVAAVLLWVGPWSLFATCPVGETIMKCHWCCVALIPIAIILLVLGALGNPVFELLRGIASDMV